MPVDRLARATLLGHGPLPLCDSLEGPNQPIGNKTAFFTATASILWYRFTSTGGSMPETRYARSSGGHIAYQIVGDGPVDVAFFGAMVTHVEMIWDDPVAARLFRRLASFSRLILFDKRGVGMSDPLPSGAPATLEERLDDVLAVLDAVGSSSAVMVGNSEGGQLAIMLAVTHPDRARALVLSSSFARVRRAPDYPCGAPDEVLERVAELVDCDWGGEWLLGLVVPSVLEDEPRARWWRQFIRRAANPGSALAQMRTNFDSDVRHLLALVQTPTIVLHAVDERWIVPSHGRYLADAIPGARFVPLPGSDHLPFGKWADLLADEVEELVTGSREPLAPDRVLSTVVFTDVVDSTRQAAELGDRCWSDLLDLHDRTVRTEIARHRGREVKATGDGFLALFDGPARAIRCADALRRELNSAGIKVRVGIHTGEVEIRGEDVGGIAVHIGARVMSAAQPDEVVVSSAVPSLIVGSGIQFQPKGPQVLKGLPGEWDLYSLQAC